MICGIAKNHKKLRCKNFHKKFDAFAFNYGWLEIEIFHLNGWIACELGLEKSCGVRHQKNKN